MLVLLTHAFPFGTTENFLEKELPFLLEKFSSLTIISLSSEGPMRPLPQGVRHIALPKEGKYQTLYRALIEPATYREWIYHPEVFYSPRSMKYLLGYMGYCHKVVEQLKRLLQQEPQFQEALFYSYWFHVQASALALLKKRHFPKLKIISRAHAYDLYEEKYPPAFIPMRRYTASAIDHIFTISEDGKKYLCTQLQVDPRDVTVERLGTENPGFLAQKTAHGQLSIASCSYLVPEKETERIVYAIERLATNCPSLAITWNHMGGGPLYNKLHALATKKLSRNVAWRIHGYVNQQSLFTFYRDHPVDLFLSTSKIEGIPVSIMEAASCGIAIVAPDVGGIREIVSHENGCLLSENCSPAEIAAAMACPLLKAKGGPSWQKWQTYFCMENNYRSFANKLLAQTNFQEG